MSPGKYSMDRFRDFLAEPDVLRICLECGHGNPPTDEQGELCLHCSTPLFSPYDTTRADDPPIKHSPPAPELIEPGVRLGKYRLTREIARGGMGIVFEADDPELHRRVAVKILQEGSSGSQEVMRLHREAAIAAQLQHPNIVSIHEVSMVRSPKGRPFHFIAMEYIQGQTLAEVLRKEGISQGEKLRMVEDAARAVAFAHSRGVIHRDLKPGNILVDNRDHVFLTDFGLARAESFTTRLTRSKTIMGTPQYMAPEQVEGRVKDVDTRSDVYALGVILYETLVGTLPFTEENPAVLYHKIVHEDPPRPTKISRSIERDLEVICLKALEKDPHYRYENAEKFVEDLSRWRKGDAILARPPSIGYRLRKKFGKRKGVVTVTTLALITVLALGGYLIPKLKRESEKKVEAQQKAEISQSRMIEELQKRTKATLSAALALRRAGRVVEMAAFAVETEEACREVIAEVPQRPEPYYELGRMCRAMMIDDRALEFQQKALIQNPDFAPALYERMILHARLYRSRIRELVSEAWMAEGRRLLEQGQGNVAAGGEIPLPSRGKLALQDPLASKIRHLIESDVRSLEGAPLIGKGELLSARGVLAWITNRREDARNALAEAISESNNLEEVYQAIATLELEAEQFEKAIEWWGEGIEADAGYLPHREGRGETYLQWGIVRASQGEDPTNQYEQAIEDYRRSIGLGPDRGEGWFGRGVVRMTWAGFLEARGENSEALYQAALSDFDEASRRTPVPSALWLSRGLANFNWGASKQARGEDPGSYYSSAVEDFNRALKVNPNRDGIWYARGLARLNWGVYREEQNEDPVPLYQAAIEDLDEALSRNPGRVVAWIHRGLSYQNRATYEGSMGRDPASYYQKALRDFGQAFQIAPS